jgi:hypothetical protein
VTKATRGRPSGAGRRAGPGAGRLSPAAWAALAFLASRALVLVTGWAAIAREGVRPVEAVMVDAAHGRLGGALASRLLDPWANWDGQWYVRIAAEGYRPAFSEAFFPLYPLLVRAVRPLAGSYVVAGTLVSWAAVALALWLLFRLVRARFDARTAAWTVAFLSFFPTSFIFTSLYGESLFLLCSVAAFFFAERRRWALAGVAGLLAVLTRPTGLLLLVPLTLLLVEQHGGRGMRGAPKALLKPRALWLALLPVGLLVYAAYLQLDTGRPLAFLDAQRHWGRTLASPLGAVADATALAWDATTRLARRGWDAVALLLPGHGGQRVACRTIVPWLALVGAAAAVAAGWRRLPAAYTAWATLLVAYPLLFPARTQPLMSYHRFVLVAFPLFITAALVTRRHTVTRWTLLGLSAALLVWSAASFALFWFVA